MTRRVGGSEGRCGHAAAAVTGGAAAGAGARRVRRCRGACRSRSRGAAAGGAGAGEALALGIEERRDRILDGGLVDVGAAGEEDLREGVGEVARGGGSMRGLGGERGLEHGREIGGDVRVAGDGVIEAAVADGAREGSAAPVAVGRREAQELVEDDAEGVDVAAAIDLLAARLLGGHVAELAWLDAGLIADEARARDAEITDLHDALARDEDVLRRDVAVDDRERRVPLVPVFVRVVEAASGLLDDARGDARRQTRAALLHGAEDPSEVGAVDVFHRQQQAALGVVGELVEVDEVGVGEAHRDVRLVDEHLAEALGARVLGEEALDDEALLGALRAALRREEHLRHPAASDAALDVEVSELLRDGHGVVHARARLTLEIARGAV